MSITQGLFSDVLANAPGGGTADWSKTLPMAGAVDWAKVTPFQVINPLTGYNYGSTQGTAAKPAEAEAPQMSEYQKWLAKQSQTYTSSDRGGGNDNREAGWYERTTPEERAAFFAENPTLAKISEAGINLFGSINPYGLASLQERVSPGLSAQYRAETLGLPLAYSQQAQAQRAAEAAAMAQNDYFSSIGVPTNSAMSMMSQQDMNALNNELASYASMSGGGGSANDSYSGSPGGESSGGSYAGGDFGYSGADRGSYF